MTSSSGFEATCMQDVRIVVYGFSLVLAAIEAGLKTLPQFSVIHIDPTLPQADAQVQALQPHIVIVDGYYECTVVCPKTILRVDRGANNQAATLNHRTFPIMYIEQLVDGIQQFLRE